MSRVFHLLLDSFRRMNRLPDAFPIKLLRRIFKIDKTKGCLLQGRAALRHKTLEKINLILIRRTLFRFSKNFDFKMRCPLVVCRKAVNVVNLFPLLLQHPCHAVDRCLIGKTARDIALFNFSIHAISVCLRCWYIPIYHAKECDKDIDALPHGHSPFYSS